MRDVRIFVFCLSLHRFRRICLIFALPDKKQASLTYF